MTINIDNYDSPLGPMLIAGDGASLVGLWFYGQRFFPSELVSLAVEAPDVVTGSVKHWLDVYFSGMIPDFCPNLSPVGSPFRLSVWHQLLQIPYAHTATYGSVAATLHSSPLAVGGAVARNPISIIIPCHRVIGSNGSLTGYAGGLSRKQWLLNHEARCKSN